MNVDAATAGTHVTGGLADFVRDLRRCLYFWLTHAASPAAPIALRDLSQGYGGGDYENWPYVLGPDPRAYYDQYGASGLSPRRSQFAAVPDLGRNGNNVHRIEFFWHKHPNPLQIRGAKDRAVGRKLARISTLWKSVCVRKALDFLFNLQFLFF